MHKKEILEKERIILVTSIIYKRIKFIVGKGKKNYGNCKRIRYHKTKFARFILIFSF